VRLTVGQQRLTQPLHVRMDPRVTTPVAGLEQQFALSKELYDGTLELRAALDAMDAVREQVKARQGQARQGAVTEALAAFDTKAEALQGAGGGFGRGGFGGGGAAVSLNGVSRALSQSFGRLQAADVAPVPRLVEAVAAQRQARAEVMARWRALLETDLPALNRQLRQAGLPVIAATR